MSEPTPRATPIVSVATPPVPGAGAAGSPSVPPGPAIPPVAPVPLHEDTPALRWAIEEDAGGAVVHFSGEIDENADFDLLKVTLLGPVVFDLGGITRINSCGVREWVNFVRDLPAVTRLEYTRCSPAIVNQLNTIYNFRGPARVRSLLAPYVCERCGVEEHKLIEIDERFPLASMMVPAFACAGCGGPMEFDELPERYLSFLREG